MPYLNAFQVCEVLCPLIQRASENDVIPRELLRQFDVARRGSCIIDVEGNSNTDNNNTHNEENNLFITNTMELAAVATKSSSNHLLALYLFEVCLSLSDFFSQRESLLAVDSSTSAAELTKPPKYH